MATNPVLVPQLQRLDRVAFRSDTRPPADIFRDGFLWRSLPSFEEFNTAREEFSKKKLSKIFQRVVEPPQYRNRKYYDKMGRYSTVPAFDINPESAVCMTLKPKMAPLFPVRKDSDPPDHPWIYAICLNKAYTTYKVQRTDKPQLVPVKEVAMKYVEPADIVCAVQCDRYGATTGTIVFTLARQLWWNSTASTEHLARRQQIIEAFAPYQNSVSTISAGFVVDSFPLPLEPTPKSPFNKVKHNPEFRGYTTDDLPYKRRPLDLD